MSLRDRLRQLDPQGRALPSAPRPAPPAARYDDPFAQHRYAHGDGAPHGDVVLDAAALDPAAVARVAKTPEAAAHFVASWVFLDTETTGLSGGAGTVAFLVGLGAFEGGRFVVRQYLMRDYPEEPAMLAAVADALRGAAVLVTYNGKTFDVPLLRDRFIMHRRRWPLEAAPHVDLLHTVRRLWRPRLGGASLALAEAELFGVARVDDLPGSLIPGQYFRAVREQNLELLEPVLEHNRLDILSLAALALRVSAVGLDPLGAPGVQVEDLVHVGRTLEAEAAHDAVACYARAAESDLAETAEDARWRLAMLAKRQADWPEAARQWQRLLHADWPLAVAALEELAKLSEHRRKDLGAAEQWCRRALDRLDRARTLHAAPDAATAWQARFTHRLTRVVRRRARSAAR